MLFDVDDDAAIGYEMERTVVMDFADEMDGVVSGICRDADGGDGLVCGFDGDGSLADFGLLPPEEGEGVTIRVNRVSGRETDGLTGTGRDLEVRNALIFIDDGLRIMIAAAFGGPLHAGAEVAELVRIETAFVGDADALHGLLP